MFLSFKSRWARRGRRRENALSDRKRGPAFLGGAHLVGALAEVTGRLYTPSQSGQELAVVVNDACDVVAELLSSFGLLHHPLDSLSVQGLAATHPGLFQRDITAVGQRGRLGHVGVSAAPEFAAFLDIAVGQ